MKGEGERGRREGGREGGRVRRLILPMGGALSRSKGVRLTVRDKQRGREVGKEQKSEGVRSKERSLTERISQMRSEQNFHKFRIS